MLYFWAAKYDTFLSLWKGELYKLEASSFRIWEFKANMYFFENKSITKWNFLLGMFLNSLSSQQNMFIKTIKVHKNHPSYTGFYNILVQTIASSSS